MNNTRRKNGKWRRPLWVDNWLIRERVARWRTTDRVKDWARRVPSRAAILVIKIYVTAGLGISALLLWQAVKRPKMPIVRKWEVETVSPLLPPVIKPKNDWEGLQTIVTGMRSDSDWRKVFQEYLRLHPAMVDSLKALQQLFPGLSY